MTTTVVITETLDAVCADWLAKHVQVVWCSHENTAQLASHLALARGLIVRTYTQVNRQLLEQAPRLAVIGRAGVGLDNIDLPACRQHGVQVVYTPHANTQSVVEYVLGLMLDHARPRPAFICGDGPSVFHELRRQHVGVQLQGLTLGILGFGRIGRRLGAVAHTLGMRLLVNDLLPDSQLRLTVDYPYHFVDKTDLYRESDIVTLHVDGRRENRHLVDKTVLDQFKPNTLLVNTSRGMVVDPVALADWAQNVLVAGGKAVLDVHDPEPPLGGNPLAGLANVRLLPHLASRTQQALQNMSWVVRDVVAVLEKRPPVHAAS